MRQLVAALVRMVGVGGGHAIAAESVDLELVLLADASRSIAAGAIRFPREGYAAAITHPEGAESCQWAAAGPCFGPYLGRVAGRA